MPAQEGFEPGIFRSRGGCLTTRPTRRSPARVATVRGGADETGYLSRLQPTDAGYIRPSSVPVMMMGTSDPAVYMCL